MGDYCSTAAFHSHEGQGSVLEKEHGFRMSQEDGRLVRKDINSRLKATASPLSYRLLRLSLASSQAAPTQKVSRS